jgi:hypothetical protein
MPGEKPEAPLLTSFEGEFHVNTIGSRMLANGNKIHLVIEGEYSSETMGSLAPLMDKDCKIRFKELVAKKTRKKVGEEDSKPLFGDGVEPGSEE